MFRHRKVSRTAWLAGWLGLGLCIKRARDKDARRELLGAKHVGMRLQSACAQVTAAYRAHLLDRVSRVCARALAFFRTKPARSTASNFLDAAAREDEIV